jgi:spermidine synthase
VLIVGGGDGGVLREVVKHPLVEQAVLCEIDAKVWGASFFASYPLPTTPTLVQKVIEISKKHLPSIAAAFDHPKATVVVGDGLKYMREHEQAFDVIITDSSDPIGTVGRNERFSAPNLP